MSAFTIGQTDHKPNATFRVLATYWEAETYVECWTESREAAQMIAAALRKTPTGDCSVQVDAVKCDDGPECDMETDPRRDDPRWRSS